MGAHTHNTYFWRFVFYIIYNMFFIHPGTGTKGTGWSTLAYGPILSNHSTDPDQIFSRCYLCQIKARLKIPAHLHMGNYVNQVHHTTNTGESREVKIKVNFA